MKQLIKLLLILLIPSLTQACLWLEGTTIDGSYTHFNDKTISSMFLKMSQNTTPQKNFYHKFYRENNQTIEYKALYKIMRGEYKQGITKLLEIEKKSPNLYSTASNLGTAYELQGNTILAIKWIKEGIKRDAHSHGGTEWLHVQILKRKLKLENNSTLLKKNHIINLPKTFDESTEIQIEDKKYTIKAIRNALFYQLRERLIFVKPKDKIVADLLYTFAKIEEQTTIIEEAEKLIMMAEEYGFDNEEEIFPLVHHIHATRTHYAIEMVLYGLGFFLLLLVLNRFIRKKGKNLRKKPISSLYFALSINLHIFLFIMLFIPTYSFIVPYFTHISILYILLILFYILAIHLAVQGFKEKNIITKPKQSILFTIILYIGFIFIVYFIFLQNIDLSKLIHYFTLHTILTLVIYLFLRWRMREYE